MCLFNLSLKLLQTWIHENKDCNNPSCRWISSGYWWLQTWIHENKDCNFMACLMLFVLFSVADMNPWKQGLQQHRESKISQRLNVLQTWIHENKDCNFTSTKRLICVNKCCRHESMKTRIATWLSRQWMFAAKQVADMNPWKQGLQQPLSLLILVFLAKLQTWIHENKDCNAVLQLNTYNAELIKLQTWIHENKDCNFFQCPARRISLICCRYESMKTRIATLKLLFQHFQKLLLQIWIHENKDCNPSER